MENIVSVLGAYLIQAQRAFFNQIVKQHSNTTNQWVNLLWFNLLGAITKNIDILQQVKAIEAQLISPSGFDSLIDLTTLEWHFGHASRPLPTEQAFVISLLRHPCMSPEDKFKQLIHLLDLIVRNHPQPLIAIKELLEQRKHDFGVFGKEAKFKWAGELAQYVLRQWPPETPPATQVLQIIADFILAPAIVCIHNTAEGDLLFALLRGFGALTTAKVASQIFENRFLHSDVKFIPFYVESLKVECGENNSTPELLKNVYKSWLQHERGLIETIQRITAFGLDWKSFEKLFDRGSTLSLQVLMPQLFSERFEILMTEEMPFTLKKKLIGSMNERLSSKFNRSKTLALSDTEKQMCITGIRKLMERKNMELVVEIMYQLFEGFSPFVHYNKLEIINFVASPEGIELFELEPPFAVILDDFCLWFVQLTQDIWEQTVSVAIMEVIVKQHNYDQLLHLFDSASSIRSNFAKRPKTVDLSAFENVKKKRDLLQHFFAHCGIAEHYLASDLKGLYQLHSEVSVSTAWNEVNLRTALSKNWTIVDPAMQLMDTFHKTSSSDVWLSLWRSLVLEQQREWNIKGFVLLNTFALCQWIRENGTKLLESKSSYDLEGYIQKFFEHEIDGTRVESLNLKDEENLLGILFPNATSISPEDRTVTNRLCHLIVERVKNIGLSVQMEFNDHLSTL
ncbi:hypothetical protein RFI_15502 [Reticulomyxa filosa]|uniref:Uncharacterized protein n=1 Tax=Reticulomyxa filosa TaxID=46433 RepID=X6N6L5_RETFI|nr:hypothetical protein RFI_15502 [Reticulomyxa filosa]|eukprot:ETO21701.1 hypothetical protein RFI_15502 [Reticulomyxa filosa]